MSGIVGIYYLDGRPVEPPEIQGMLNTISHRGPDGSGIWTDGSIGLGHQMLHTTPESLHEKLPLTNKTGALAITADARIDNRDELFRALDFNGRPRETIPDSELILAAYEKWGERCPEKLLGDFAFAIWDRKNQRLFCARDPIGIKPFFYYFDGKTFYWGSEPRAIYEHSKISKEPNLQLICLYLLNRFDEREETLYKNIYRLPGSQCMVLQNGEIRKGQYWDINPDDSIYYKTDEEYAEHFLSIFKDSVKARLRSNGPVGALLSGGLDSSSIVCTAQSIYQEKTSSNHSFETFSVVFDTFDCDERSFIKDVVSKCGVKANLFTFEKFLNWLDFEQMTRYRDIGYFTTLLILGPPLKEAQERKFRIILDGLGGDDLLAVDFDHLTDLFSERKYYKLMVQLWNDSVHSSYSPYELFLSYCIKPLIPKNIKAALKRTLKAFRENDISPGLNRAFLDEIGVLAKLKTERNSIQFHSRAQQHIYEVLRYGWNHTIALDMFERFESYFYIEGRHPFLDRRMIQFCLCIPPEQRWSSKWTKAILRKSMANILPESVKIRRTKPDLDFVIDYDFKSQQATKLEKIVTSSALAELGVVNGDYFIKIWKDYRDGISKNNTAGILEKIAWLEIWYDLAIKKKKGAKNGEKIFN